MKIRTVLLIAILGAIAAFSAHNWQAFIAPTSLSLGVTTVEAPLGLVMLALCIFLIAFFLIFVLYMQTTVLMDARHNAKELRANRELADKAEASRFTELRVFLESELSKLATDSQEARSAMQTRLDKLEHELRSSVEQSGNTLSAYIGELEDRMESRATGKIAGASGV